MNTFIKLILIAILLSSCARRHKTHSTTPVVKAQRGGMMTYRINEAVIELGEQLFLNSFKAEKQKKIAITSFVNLDKLKNSSTFGRSLSESLINELHTRKFSIIDLRTQKNISINKQGQFYISRDLKKLKKKKDEIYVLVGTYSKFDYKSLVLNARLVNYDTSEVISTARVVYVYEDCSLFNLCTQKKMKIVRDNDEY